MADQFRRQAHRQVRRQDEAVQLRPRNLHLARRSAQERGKQVPVDGPLSFQGGQPRLRLGDQRALGQKVGPGGLAEGQLPLDRQGDGPLDLDQPPGLVDLGAQLRIGDRGDHHIGGQGLLRRRKLEPGHVLLGRKALHRATIGPEKVGGEADRELAGGQVVDAVARLGRAGERPGKGLVTGRNARPHLRQIGPPLRGRQFPGRPQRRLRGIEGGVVAQRPVHQGVDGRGAEPGPPPVRHGGVRPQRTGVRRQGQLDPVAQAPRGRRRMEVRSHGAGGQDRQAQEAGTGPGGRGCAHHSSSAWRRRSCLVSNARSMAK